MASNSAGRHLGMLISLLLGAHLSSCADKVVLQDQDGAVQLQYDCGSFKPAARSTSEHAVVRAFTARAVRFADERGDLESVQLLVRARLAGEPVELERLLVEYLCGGGGLADPMPNGPYIAPSVGGAEARGAPTESGLDIGMAAPDFNLPVLDDGFFEGSLSFVSLSDHSGQHVLLTFGGPWCPPCVQELMDLLPIWGRFQGRGLSVFEVLYKDTPENGWRWNQEHIPGAFQTLVDDGFQVAGRYGVRGVPKTYLIGPDGEIAWSSEGWGPHMPGVLEELLDRVLPEEASSPLP